MVTRRCTNVKLLVTFERWVIVTGILALDPCLGALGKSHAKVFGSIGVVYKEQTFLKRIWGSYSCGETSVGLADGKEGNVLHGV